MLKNYKKQKRRNCMKTQTTKKWLSLLLAVGLVVSTFTACGGSGKTDTTKAASSVETEAKTDVSVAEN